MIAQIVNLHGLIKATGSSQSTILACTFTNITGTLTSILDLTDSNIIISSAVNSSPSGRRLNQGTLITSHVSNCFSPQGSILKFTNSNLTFEDFGIHDSTALNAIV